MTFALKRLDHVNVRTGNLDRMRAWYRDILGMSEGPRPDFSFPGAWMYAEGHPIVHLVGRDVAPIAGHDDLNLEHFAISAQGLGALIDRLEAASERYEMRHVPGFPIVQVNVWDPDGNHIHIDFNSAEAQALDL